MQAETSNETLHMQSSDVKRGKEVAQANSEGQLTGQPRTLPCKHVSIQGQG